ncbi:MAG: hypothetical protein ABIH39_03365 [Candidatus Margulisiibacteriota bacterium]
MTEVGSVHDYSASQVADDARAEIMDALQQFAGAKADDVANDVSTVDTAATTAATTGATTGATINKDGNIDFKSSSNELVSGLGNDFDPTSGTGALILDDSLSKISTVQQCNGQLISDSNKNKSKMQQLGVNQ